VKVTVFWGGFFGGSLRRCMQPRLKAMRLGTSKAEMAALPKAKRKKRKRKKRKRKSSAAQDDLQLSGTLCFIIWRSTARCKVIEYK